MSEGTTVTCHAWAPKTKSKPRQISRALCVGMPEPYCSECPNATFTMQLPRRIDHKVSCPRWTTTSKSAGEPPSEYVPVLRETCLTTRPFEFCSSCPNSKSEEPARLKPGWLTKEKKK